MSLRRLLYTLRDDLIQSIGRRDYSLENRPWNSSLSRCQGSAGIIALYGAATWCSYRLIPDRLIQPANSRRPDGSIRDLLFAKSEDGERPVREPANARRLYNPAINYDNWFARPAHKSRGLDEVFDRRGGRAASNTSESEILSRHRSFFFFLPKIFMTGRSCPLIHELPR